MKGKIVIPSILIALTLMVSITTSPISLGDTNIKTSENMIFSKIYQDDNETANNTEQPAFGNNILYLQSNSAGDLWMNANKNDPNSDADYYFQRYFGNGAVTEEFPENPVLDHTLYLDSNISVIMDIHIEITEGIYDDNVKLTLQAGSKTLGEGTDTVGDNNVHVEFTTTESEINASDNLNLIIELSFTGEFAYEIYTDGSSTIDLPIVDLNEMDSDEDGYSDQEEIDIGSDPYDPESFPETKTVNKDDDDGNNNMIIFGVVTVVIIGIAVVFIKKRKY